MRPGAMRPGGMAAMLAGLLMLLAAASPVAARSLVVAGSTDREAMVALLAAFEAAHPDIDVTYIERETIALYDEVLDGTIQPTPDVIISSAADLQVRLVNDGFSRPFRSEATQRLPDWARWRDEAFGFTFEPLVFVINPALVPRERIPRTREALASLVYETPEFHGRVATYDIRQSGIGYLIASLDQTSMSDYWPFVDRVSERGLLTACCTVDVIDMVASGRAVVGYNVLGSYARARQSAGVPIEIVFPEDFMFVIARVAIIMKDAPHPGEAERFIDFLLSGPAQRIFAHDALLSAIDANVTDGLGQATIRAAARGPIRPIALNATLLAMTDQLKRRRFVDLWDAVVSEP